MRQEDARRTLLTGSWQPKMNRTHPGDTHTHGGGSLGWLCSSRSGCGFYCCHSDITYLHILFWQAGRYDESLKHLEGLQELNKEDYKISMNEAIVKFYKSGQTTTGALKQSLMVLKNQVTAAQAHILQLMSGTPLFRFSLMFCLCLTGSHHSRRCRWSGWRWE